MSINQKSNDKLSKKDVYAIDRLISKLQSRPARFNEMETVINSFYMQGFEKCFSLTISSKSCAISTTMSRLLDEYPGVFIMILKDSLTCMLKVTTLQSHKWRAISRDLKDIDSKIEMHGSNFHFTLS